MAGNVWEWCLNKSESHGDATIDDLSESRVLGGGSWFNDLDYARADDRIGLLPLDRNYFVGFRVLCASPIR